jgi:hypothetical protein
MNSATAEIKSTMELTPVILDTQEAEIRRGIAV